MTYNVDSHEIAKFDAIATDWWDPNGEFKPLHALNPLRLEFIENQIALTGKNVIDIGCGGGILTESLAKKASDVVGIDLSTGAINAAIHHAKANQIQNLRYECTPTETMAEQYPEQFDIVTCMEMLEHVPDPLAIVQACAKLCKPDGFVFFSTINRNPKAYLQAVLAAEYILHLIPKGTHDYKKFIRPAELESWARESELRALKLAGIKYNPITREYSLSNKVDVNYLLSCQRRM